MCHRDGLAGCISFLVCKHYGYVTIAGKKETVGSFGTSRQLRHRFTVFISRCHIHVCKVFFLTDVNIHRDFLAHLAIIRRCRRVHLRSHLWLFKLKAQLVDRGIVPACRDKLVVNLIQARLKSNSVILTQQCILITGMTFCRLLRPDAIPVRIIVTVYQLSRRCGIVICIYHKCSALRIQLQGTPAACNHLRGSALISSFGIF